jgi:diaminobutyrate-2-oxoglutarate transaminase
VPLAHVTFVAYEGYYGPSVDTIEMLATQLADPSSGLDQPAAVIVECIQGEGGVNPASADWLRRLADLAAGYKIPLIIDDIQAGCGRSGDFFSFEEAGIEPDMVVLSKSLSGNGLPISLVLIRPELDVWEPGAHTGTFRGNNLAFVGATAALRAYWADGSFAADIKRKGSNLRERLSVIADRYPGRLEARGRGLFLGLAARDDPGFGARVSREAFQRGVIIESAGARDEVLKVLPPLVIDDEALSLALDAIEAAIQTQLAPA